jgi:hypothetical protein
MMTVVIHKIRNHFKKKSRQKKLEQFLCIAGGNDVILDVGVDTVTNNPHDNYLLFHGSRLSRMIGLTVDPAPSAFQINGITIPLIRYGGHSFPLRDRAVDIVHANAVIEHVGDDQQQVDFVSEMVRVARKTVFLTTPNRFFPVETHTNIFLLHQILPKQILDNYLRWIGKSFATGTYMNLLSIRDLRLILNTVSKHQNISYKIISNRFLGWTATFSVVIWRNERLRCRHKGYSKHSGGN